ncbi:hypothetical protein E2C01_061281 [Portunus trituberculatus]|uniref:Uncharacterized protein n=1 Tax=Portunus trituberculatus TaxID=210409 RepID=A0A5B7HC06_PORTR|nr:hypothetical protein [Portunus trituberculatus]
MIAVREGSVSEYIARLVPHEATHLNLSRVSLAITTHCLTTSYIYLPAKPFNRSYHSSLAFTSAPSPIPHTKPTISPCTVSVLHPSLLHPVPHHHPPLATVPTPPFPPVKPDIRNYSALQYRVSSASLRGQRGEAREGRGVMVIGEARRKKREMY